MITRIALSQLRVAAAASVLATSLWTLHYVVETVLETAFR